VQNLQLRKSVIMIYLRLSNICYRISVNNQLDIKVFDWDYADFFGVYLHSKFHEFVQLPNNLYPHNLHRACADWYEHYLKIIYDQLELSSLEMKLQLL
jgi:hypothetical protein